MGNKKQTLNAEVVEILDEDAVLVGDETAAETTLTTNVYAEIRKRLALQGVPMDQVAFIHDSKTPEARAKLFAAVNCGEIRVLLGSTEKMGTGMNVQERLIAMHTITPPWRPGDIEQQVGRMVRQGNLFPQAFQFVHITEGSFDAYVWQLLENKAGFIGQLARGQTTTREVEDVDDTVLTFSEIKALASGNPLIMQKIVMDAEFQRLSALRASWFSSLASVRSSVRGFEFKKTDTEQRIIAYLDAIKVRDANTGEKFSIQLKPSLDADTLEIEIDRDKAGRKIRLLAEHAAMRLVGRQRAETFIEIGTYRGCTVNVTVSTLDDKSQPIPQLFFRIKNEIFQINAETDTGLTRSMDIRLKSFDTVLTDAQELIRVLDKKTAAALAEIDRPWEHEQKFVETEAKVRELEALLNKDKNEKDTQLPAPVPTPTFARKVISQKRDTAGEVQSALDAIKAMMTNPAIVARLAGDADILTVTGLDELSKEIEQKQALFDFGTASLLQLDLFGGSVAPATKKSRRH